MEEDKKIEELPKKPKRILSEKQKEALARGRAKAHERLREFRKNKGSIEKSDEPVKEEKLKKKITKEEVNYGNPEQKQEFVEVHNKIIEKEEEEKLQLKESPKIIKKKKPKKQVVIVEESSSSSESEEEQVIVRRSRRKKREILKSPPPQAERSRTNIPQKPSILFY